MKAKRRRAWLGHHALYILERLIRANPLALLLLASLVGGASANALPADGDLRPFKLSVEHDYGAPVIADKSPRLGWIPSGVGRGLRQTAYQILVASSAEKLAAGESDLWDSGKVQSADTLDIHYSGRPLVGNSRAYWKVMIWDGLGRPSPWSQTGAWVNGPQTAEDWHGSWISHDVQYRHPEKPALALPPSPYLRKSFIPSRTPSRAMLFVTALGLYKVSLNGRDVSDDYFAPGWTDYNKRLYYRGYDVTDLMRSGENVMGVILADGWFSGYVGYGRLEKLEKERDYYGGRPWLRAYLMLEFPDGTREIVGTDGSWKATVGGTREADILMGETFDARLEPEGWKSPGFDDSKWAKVLDGASRLHLAPKPELAPYPGSPVVVRESLEPRAITQPRPGVFILDAGKNLAGIARLKVGGASGTKVTLRFGEMLDQKGELVTANLRHARATDTYILKGAQDGETWSPKFSYHGFRYVEMTGFPGTPTKQDITILQLSANAPETWTLDVTGDRSVRGKPITETLMGNIRTTQLANFIEIPTDCPQRDERLGWTGDAQVFARSATYLSDVRRFMAKWLVDLDDAQTWSGAYPAHAPAPYQKEWVAPGYMDAGIIVPYEMWRSYGDKQLIRRLWPGMKKFMAYQARNTGDDFLRKAMGGWGDHLSVGRQTSHAFITAIYYVHELKLMTEMAEGIGQPTDALSYGEEHVKAHRAFVAAFIQEDGRITDDTQTAYAMALYMDIYPPSLRRKGARRLAKLIRANGGALATGFLGTKPLLPALSSNGHADLAHSLLLTTKYPSWGYEIANGATSIWERWNSYSAREGLYDKNLTGSDYGMNSLNHYAFGSVAEWMFETVGGISPLKPGFSSVRFAPEIRMSPYSGVTSTYRSARGDIVSAWTKAGRKVSWRIVIPANVGAEVILPVGERGSTKESGVALSEIRGARIVSKNPSETRLALASGEYHFSFTL